MSMLTDLLNWRENAASAATAADLRTRLSLQSEANANLMRELTDVRAALVAAQERASAAETRAADTMQKFIDWQCRRSGDPGVFSTFAPEPRSTEPVSFPQRQPRPSLSERARSAINDAAIKTADWYRDLGLQPTGTDDANQPDSST